MRILTAWWPGLALVLSLSSMMWLPIGWAKGPSSSSLPPPPSFLPYSANVKLTARLSALVVRKMPPKMHLLQLKQFWKGEVEVLERLE